MNARQRIHKIDGEVRQGDRDRRAEFCAVDRSPVRTRINWGGADWGTLLPVLPFDRSGRALAADPASIESSDSECDYWRYCALDGFLCSCCGGSVTACPPGAEPSAVTWIGTCHNSKDGKDYLISYNDCCGKTTCGRCLCNANIRERPGYSLGVHNDINWCMANTPSMYHCTVAVIVGVAD